MIRLVMLCLLVAAPARAADVTVLTAGAFKSVVAELIPAFEARTGDKVILRNDTVGALVRRINGGEAFDVVLMSPAGLEDLGKTNKIDRGTEVRLARSGIGVGVKAGAPAPDIATTEAFKASVTNARAVAIIDPASGGSSGIYLAKLFDRLGVKPNLVPIKGGLAAEAVVDGRADLVVHQISEIMAVPGVTLVGPLPPDIQNETVYAGAIAAQTQSPRAAQDFLEMLTSPTALSVLTAKGLMPP